MMQKVNLKRKFDEDTESDEEEVETMRVKRQRNEAVEPERRKVVKGSRGRGRTIGVHRKGA